MIKISGVSDELLSLVDARWKSQHFADRSEYIRDLVRRDLLPSSASLVEGVKSIFGTVHEELAAYGLNESEIEEDVDNALQKVRSERRQGRVRKAG